MQCRNDVEKELKVIIQAYGTNKTLSLAGLRSAVGSLRGDPRISSGEQMDAGDFLLGLLQSIDENVYYLFELEEAVEPKFLIKNVPSNCPICNIPIEYYTELTSLLILTIPPATNGSLRVSTLLENYGIQGEPGERRCSYCCPHGDGTCPRTAETCKMLNYVETRRITKTSNYLLLQLQ